MDLFGRSVGFVGQQVTALRVLTTSGVVRPYSPSVLHKIARSLLDWGFGPAGGFATLAARYPARVGLVDELGELTFLQMHERSNALADALAARGVGPRNGVAIMCRNHRGFVDVSVAAAKLGADIIYLNTAFAGPQLVEVLEREQPGIVVHDQEFGHLLGDAEGVDAVLAWCDADPGDAETLEELIRSGSVEDRRPPEKPSRIIILTSGTTGAPKGAPRTEAGVGDAVSLLSRLPLKAGWRTHIAAPLFHTWGWAHLAMSMLLGTTMVLRRRFEPEDCLRAVTEERCDSLVVIPVMLQRIMQLPQAVRDRYDLSQVKVVAASGSALAGDLGIEWMDQFGDTLYNIYGSTEVAYATVATPADLRAAPGTAGKPPHATVVRILDEKGDEVPRGESGRIFVGNGMLFEGYTGGGNKDMHDGLMASGDVGRFDQNGRLFIEGRDDEMVVSGGENVFPKEVEDCLARHEGVVEAACVGVDDADFGKRLRAYVVLTEPGAVTADDLRSWVRSNLARYKVPRDVVFVDQLPRNATGKVVKRELPDVAEPDAEAQRPRHA